MLTPADRAEIAELSHRYAVLVDERDLAGVGVLFAEDAALVLPEPPTRLTGSKTVSGRAAIEGALGAVHNLTATTHAVLALTVDEDDADGATGLVSGQAHHLTAGRDGYANTVWFLRYRDRYRRSDGRWLFARRQLDITWIERRPVLLPTADSSTEFPVEAS